MPSDHESSVVQGAPLPLPFHPHYPVASRRLDLRPLETRDTESLLAYRSRADVCRWVPFDPMDRGLVAQKLTSVWARHAITSEGEGIILGVSLRAIGQVIGDVSLMLTSAEHRSGEIGWVLHPDYGGEGYATEAAHAMLHLAFDHLGLHRMVARIDARNAASLRLGDRLGMRREAYLVENEWFKGGWSDEVDMAMLELEWTAQHAADIPPCAGPHHRSDTAR